ncbi:MAG: bifunctional pyr operon transcriptional regulator/uracil phosphoribosyltransferase PyrR [Candidatus Cyclobacteriaceae bacterium M3_2C_046]
MQKRLILDSHLLNITINRLCHQLMENHNCFENAVMLGLQPRGIYLAERIKAHLQHFLKKEISLGYLDATFHRDDFRRRDFPIKANATRIPFIIEDKDVIMIDDVLFTGRTTRAGLDAMNSFGRPRKVELLVLVNRKYSRDIPIEPNYVGKHVNTILSQRVLVEWKEQGMPEDNIWLVDKMQVNP